MALGSAAVVGVREALGEEADEQGGREADDVQVVALDPFDEQGAEALDGVGAGASLPLSHLGVAVDLVGTERPEGHSGHDAMQLLPPRPPQAEPGHDLVRSSRQSLEHLARRVRGRRLAEPLPVEEHVRVDAEHELPAALYRARLPGRVLDRVVADLLVVGRNDDERDGEQFEEFPPLRRRRRQDERL